MMWPGIVDWYERGVHDFDMVQPTTRQNLDKYVIIDVDIQFLFASIDHCHDDGVRMGK